MRDFWGDVGLVYNLYRSFRFFIVEIDRSTYFRLATIASFSLLTIQASYTRLFSLWNFMHIHAHVWLGYLEILLILTLPDLWTQSVYKRILLRLIRIEIWHFVQTYVPVLALLQDILLELCRCKRVSSPIPVWGLFLILFVSTVSVCFCGLKISARYIRTISRRREYWHVLLDVQRNSILDLLLWLFRDRISFEAVSLALCL